MEVKVLKQDHFGRGIASINNKLCFIDKALPNEICDIDIVLEKKNYLEGKINKIIVESNDRVKPICPYYDICGGCNLLHQSYDKQLEFKKDKVKDILNRFAGIDINIEKINYSNNLNYRNKIVLHNLGLYENKSNIKVDIEECLLVDKRINEIIKRLKKYDIEEVTIKTSSLNETMLIVSNDINIDEFKDINSIYIKDKLVYGTNYIKEKINDLVFYIYKDSFFQVNYNVMNLLYNKIINYYKENTSLNVCDLYCGTGTIGMLISKYCKSVIGIEINKDAVDSANTCKDINNISNIEFYLGKVEDKIDLIKNVDSVVVDPPRSGLDSYTISTLLKLNPKSIIYVSCDPVTLARDLKILKDKYDIKDIELFDMFPNTYHVESFVTLERRNK